MFYTVLGGLVGVGVAHLAGFVFGRNKDGAVDPELLSPCIRKRQKTQYSSVSVDENTLKDSTEKS